MSNETTADEGKSFYVEGLLDVRAAMITSDSGVVFLTGKPPPFWANWGEQWKNTTTNFNGNAQGWVKGMENRAKTIQMPRWEMPGAGWSLEL